MAQPVLQQTSIGNRAANTVTFSVSLPGTINSGDFLLALIASDGNPTFTWDNTTAGTWTNFYTTTNASAVTKTVWYKYADGTEDGKVLKVTASAAEMYAYHVSRWTGVHPTSPLERTLTFTLTVTASVPAKTAGAGIKDYVWISTIATDGNVSVTSAPTSYVNYSNPRAVNTGGAGLGFATLSLTATTVSSNRWILSAAEDAIVAHMALRPTDPAGADQTATPSLKASALTFYQSTLQARRVFDVPHKASGLTFYTQSIAAGDISLTAGFVPSAFQAFTPQLGIPSQSLTAGLVASGFQGFTPTLDANRAFDAPQKASSLQFFSPSVAARSQVLLNFFDRSPTLYPVSFGEETTTPTSTIFTPVRLNAVGLEKVSLVI